MKRLIVVVKPFKVQAVMGALLESGAASLTYGEARGYGRQKGHLDLYRDGGSRITFLPKLRLECVVPASRVEEAIERVSMAARTGRIGDGKIFVGEVE
ncbi:MAG: P-II family nitrogen regulator [Planctomycetota bacterium]|jgi:nitrogen regulatory protein P-II 1